MQITFDELPQNVQDYITKICGDDGFEMIRCEDTNCILISGTIIGAVSYFFSSPSVVWMNSQEIKDIYNILIGPTMWKKGGSAKTEAKANASRENGKLGGRPRKKKEE